MPWDTMIGVSRRAWARNENAVTTVMRYNSEFAETDHITLPYESEKDDEYIKAALAEAQK